MATDTHKRVVGVLDALGELGRAAEFDGAVRLVLLHDGGDVDVVAHLELHERQARLCVQGSVAYLKNINGTASSRNSNAIKNGLRSENDENTNACMRHTHNIIILMQHTEFESVGGLVVTLGAQVGVDEHQHVPPLLLTARILSSTCLAR